MSDVNVRVVARFRPPDEVQRRMQSYNHSEDKRFGIDFEGTTSASIKVPPDVTRKRGEKTTAAATHVYTFDRVFPPECTQNNVFDEVALETVKDVLAGYNGTIFAYGQTGSGKTHTMFGVMNDGTLAGLVPRCTAYLFEGIQESTGVAEVMVKCSFLEIYRENILDLLADVDEGDDEDEAVGGGGRDLPKRDRQLKRKGANPVDKALPSYLDIRERGGVVTVPGLTEKYCADPDDVLALLRRGEKKRSTAATAMNAVSSRSHSVITLTLTQKMTDGSTRTSKLNLADLAGSERTKKTQAKGQTLDEAKAINQSLSSLGNCINALTEKGRSHIPFRDSKLTFLLQESLGGNTKTTLLVCASMEAFNASETVSTLNFARRAKMIKNRAHVNKHLSPNQLMSLVSKLRKLLEAANIRIADLEALVKSLFSGEKAALTDEHLALAQSIALLQIDEVGAVPLLASNRSVPALALLPQEEQAEATADLPHDYSESEPGPEAETKQNRSEREAKLPPSPLSRTVTVYPVAQEAEVTRQPPPPPPPSYTNVTPRRGSRSRPPPVLSAAEASLMSVTHPSALSSVRNSTRPPPPTSARRRPSSPGSATASLTSGVVLSPSFPFAYVSPDGQQHQPPPPPDHRQYAHNETSARHDLSQAPLSSSMSSDSTASPTRMADTTAKPKVTTNTFAAIAALNENGYPIFHRVEPSPEPKASAEARLKPVKKPSVFVARSDSVQTSPGLQTPQLMTRAKLGALVPEPSFPRNHKSGEEEEVEDATDTNFDMADVEYALDLVGGDDHEFGNTHRSPPKELHVIDTEDVLAQLCRSEAVVESIGKRERKRRESHVVPPPGVRRQSLLTLRRQSTPSLAVARGFPGTPNLVIARGFPGTPAHHMCSAKTRSRDPKKFLKANKSSFAVMSGARSRRPSLPAKARRPKSSVAVAGSDGTERAIFGSGYDRSGYPAPPLKEGGDTPQKPEPEPSSVAKPSGSFEISRDSCVEQEGCRQKEETENVANVVLGTDTIPEGMESAEDEEKNFDEIVNEVEDSEEAGDEGDEGDEGDADFEKTVEDWLEEVDGLTVDLQMLQEDKTQLEADKTQLEDDTKLLTRQLNSLAEAFRAHIRMAAFEESEKAETAAFAAKPPAVVVPVIHGKGKKNKKAKKGAKSTKDPKAKDEPEIKCCCRPPSIFTRKFHTCTPCENQTCDTCYVDALVDNNGKRLLAGSSVPPALPRSTGAIPTHLPSTPMTMRKNTTSQTKDSWFKLWG